LEHGRRPGKFPPVTNIRDWVRSKLGIEENKVNSIAYLIGRKIANDGTEVYKDISKGIELDKLVSEALRELEIIAPDELLIFPE